jgi:hypothetical protein
MDCIYQSVAWNVSVIPKVRGDALHGLFRCELLIGSARKEAKNSSPLFASQSPLEPITVWHNQLPGAIIAAVSDIVNYLLNKL